MSVVIEKELIIDQSVRDLLNQSAKWAYILSLIVFIGVGILLLLITFFRFLEIEDGIIHFIMMYVGSSLVIYVFFMLLSLFPAYYLYKFAFNVKRALAKNDNEALMCCFRYLKANFKFIVFFIIGMPILLLIIAFPFIAVLFSDFSNYK